MLFDLESYNLAKGYKGSFGKPRPSKEKTENDDVPDHFLDNHEGFWKDEFKLKEEMDKMEKPKTYKEWEQRLRYRSTVRLERILARKRQNQEEVTQYKKLFRKVTFSVEFILLTLVWCSDINLVALIIVFFIVCQGMKVIFMPARVQVGEEMKLHRILREIDVAALHQRSKGGSGHLGQQSTGKESGYSGNK
ncbi:hypothetical protein FT663_03305 [Candidozyma haemuli var. vulneris]|nr:hypothetical protein FT662_03402 [[Candida] haemuloni var. vulneris]KAF3990156.1 hypothetical protein FT663_03305 [[Candida] haemuloni var. vulneris]